jgi:hypothetical protein
MNDSFKIYSLKIFNELNINVSKKFESLESRGIERNINLLFNIEDKLNEIEEKLDISINKLVAIKISNEIINDLDKICVDA